jgi:CheY-like chemotaxis protein
VTQSDLLDAILTALSLSPNEPASLAAETGWRKLESLSPAESPEVPVSRATIPQRILLVEDNIVNQKVAVHLLEQWGHAVTVAANGREALSALETGTFDLILMDVQMPEMDGFEATAAIRAREAQASRDQGAEGPPSAIAHIPIFAMTAHAMKGDRERCLEAGMNGYISKPIQAQELFDLIEEWTSEVLRPQPRERPNGHKDDLFGQMMLRFDGDLAFMMELTTAFLDECVNLLGAMREAVKQGDASALARAAHSLKGAVANFPAQPAVEAALRLEMIGRQGDLTHAAEAYHALVVEIERLKPALVSLREKCLS